MIGRLLNRLGLRTQHRAPPPALPDDAEDQTYSEAAIDNAVHDSERAVARLSALSLRAARTNARLVAGIERMKTSGEDKGELLADLVRGMKTGHGNH